MPQEIARFVNFNNGELDPDASARREIKNYYASVAVGTNLVTTPTGPMDRRPGTGFIDYVRHVLEAQPLVDATLTAPNGGTAADAAAVDGASLETDTVMGIVDPYVVLEVDFGVAVRVGAVDVIDYAVKSGVVEPTTPPFEYPWPDFSGGWGGPGGIIIP